ncbi:transcriptional regulator GcvA [Marinobacterium lutimaris]|uniref:transcriptional regulator GcvA n=1 Tax=Marinobacterium lutimaris TaxID=568106 RepID=UPI002E162164
MCRKELIIRRLPPLNALRVFEAAARHGSFNKAAEELCVTPSAVSHQLKSLEEFLGQKLFRREKRQVYLTGAGERYLGSVQLALDEVESATRRLMTATNTSAVNISVAPFFLTRWLVPRITRFQQRFPDVELRFSSTMGYIDFEHSDTDMAVYYGRGNWEGVESHLLRNIVQTPVFAPSFLEGDKAINTPEDMVNHTLIYISGRRHEWNRALREIGVSLSAATRTMSFSSTSLAVSAAIEGIGIALADRVLVEREIETGKLAAPFELAFDTQNAFYLVYKEKRALTYGMRAFRDWIMEEMQNDIADRNMASGQDGEG